MGSASQRHHLVHGVLTLKFLHKVVAEDEVLDAVKKWAREDPKPLLRLYAAGQIPKRKRNRMKLNRAVMLSVADYKKFIDNDEKLKPRDTLQSWTTSYAVGTPCEREVAEATVVGAGQEVRRGCSYLCDALGQVLRAVDTL